MHKQNKLTRKCAFSFLQKVVGIGTLNTGSARNTRLEADVVAALQSTRRVSKDAFAEKERVACRSTNA